MKTTKQPAFTKNRERLFKIIAIAIPFIFILMLEGILRLSGYGDNLKLFVTSPIKGYEKYMMVNPEIGKKYFQKLEYTSPANDIFLKDKPDSTFRVFVMGSSVVFGFPYDRNLMFSRILEQQLSDAYPGRDIEVVNTSITAINSFTLLDYIDQILGYEADAVLIYEGHNEFYGAFGIGSNERMSRNRNLARIHITLMDYRFYQLMRNFITYIQEKMAGSVGERSQGTLMSRIVADKDILMHSEEYNITMDRYTRNMGEILEKAQKKGVKVFISELVSNINGMEPFNSVAVDSLEAAIDVFNRARVAEQQGDYAEARKLYYRAKDLDALRFRASEDINTIVRELSNTHDAITVPMQEVFEQKSPNRLIGNNYMTEHVHPNIAGNFLMADAFFQSVASSGILGQRSTYEKDIDYYRHNWGYTRLDSLLAHHRVQLLMGHWPFVTQENEVRDYVSGYRPKGYVDSLAFTVMKNPDVKLGEVRLKLARSYEKAGRIDLAYQEYEALLRMNPYIAVNYRDAASSLLQLQDLPRALDYLLKSLEFEDSFFARFRIGEIYLIMGDYKNAITFLEQAHRLAPDENKDNVLGKMYPALQYAGHTDKAAAIAVQLRNAGATQFLNVPPRRYFFNDYIPFQTRETITTAQQLKEEGSLQQAIDTLEASLQVYDSHMARRMLGDIYFDIKEHDKAQFHLTKVYDLFKYDTRFLHSMTMLYIVQQDLDNARKCLQELREIDPDYAHLRLLSMMISS